MFYVGIIFLLLLYLWYRKSMADYWKFSSKGITESKPWPFIGCSDVEKTVAIFSGKTSMMDLLIKEPDQETKEKVERGWLLSYFLGNANFVLTDPELIKEVNVKKFECFTERNSLPVRNGNKAMKYGKKMLTIANGDEWKTLRAALSPSFTTGKLKHIVETMSRTGPKFQQYLANEIKNNDTFEMRALMSKFGIDVIAETVFGMDMKVFDGEEETAFVQYSRKMINTSLNFGILFKIILFAVAPDLAVSLGITLVDMDPFEYFHNFGGKILDDIQGKDVKMNSIIQALIDKANEGQEDTSEANDAEDQMEKDARLNMKIDVAKVLDRDAIIDSCVVFFIAGFDTFALTMSLVTYQLAIHEDIQARVIKEVDSLSEELEDEQHTLMYKDLDKLKYLEMVIKESMRLNPILPIIERLCTKDCVLSNGMEFSKDDKVQYSPATLHYNEKFWPEPKKFDPDRFSKENKAKIKPYTYLPFGAGPRNCIGMRFAMMEMKVALYYIFQSFTIKPSERTPIPIKYDKRSFLLVIDSGNHLKFESRT